MKTIVINMIECVTKAILILVTQNMDQGWLLIRILTKADQNTPRLK